MSIFDPAIFDPAIFDTGGSSTSAPAGLASGTGAANNPSASVKPTAGQASGTGTALDATVDTHPAVYAMAELASGSGSAFGPATSVKPAAGLAAGSGSAGQASTAVKPTAGLASGTGAAADATAVATGPETLAIAETARGVGVAYGPLVFIDPVLIGASAEIPSPVYHGQSRALHVDEGNFEAVPVGPQSLEPMMVGAAPKITSHPDSPDQWHDETIFGSFLDVPSYYGRSQAIHVYGAPLTRTPPPPVPGCRCCAETGAGITCNGTDDLTARTTSTGWGLSDIDSRPWTPTYPAAFQCQTGVGGTYKGTPFGFGANDLVFPLGEIPVGPNDFLVRIQIDAGADGLVTSFYITGATNARDYGIDLYRAGTTITGAAYGSHGAGYTIPSSVTGLLSGYAGQEFYLRFHINSTDTDVSWKVWFVGDAEPGAWTQTFSPATAYEMNPAYGIVQLRAAFGAYTEVSWKSVSISTNLLCGTGYAGGTPYTRYIVSNKEAHHSGDPAYSSKPSGLRVNNDYNAFRTPPNLWQSELLSVGVTPGWRNQADGFAQREWFQIGGGGDIRAKIEFNPDFNSTHATVGLFRFINPVSVFPNPELTDHATIDDVLPYLIVESGEWFDVSTPVYVSPDGLGHPYTFVLYDTATWQGYSVDEPFLITIEGVSGGTWSGGGGGTDHAVGDCTDPVDADCTACDDPVTGLPIPDFTPGFMPTFRKQIGDPTTNLDSFICTLESAAMVLDWHTRGAVSVWGGELIPYCGKTEAEIGGSTGHPGTSLDNARQAWFHWGQYLGMRSGGSWADLIVALQEGRAVILQGDYGVFSNAIKCQDTFDGNHAISVYPYQVADRLLCGDPLCSTFYGVPIAALQNYAETLGRAVYGTTSPQKILFAVSRPWVA